MENKSTDELRKALIYWYEQNVDPLKEENEKLKKEAAHYRELASKLHTDKKKLRELLEESRR